MIDFHTHILPNIDDGPESIEESMEMAALLHKAGFQTIYCTPHLMKGFYDMDNRTVLAATLNLQKKIHAVNIKVEILPGREYYLDEFIGSYLKHPLTLGKTKYILIEIPNYVDGKFVKEVCFRIKCSGFIPMIAHPERCELFAASVKKKKTFFELGGIKNKNATGVAKESGLITYLQEIGCAFQGNLGSFDGLYGHEVQQTANHLKEKKVFTHFGTDAHSLMNITRLNLSSAGGGVTT